LRWRDIFSETFKRHQKEDLARVLHSEYHSEGEMLRQWQKPWLFSRVFLYMALLLAAMAVLHNVGFSLYFASPIMLIGNLAVPLTMLLLIWELNIPRRVSLMEALVIMFIGGIGALAFSALINNLIPGPATKAAFTEEPFKLLVAVVFILIRRKKRLFILDGLVIGAAIAAGFTAFESISYVARQALISVGGRTAASPILTNNMWFVLLNRGLRAFFSHILFTAPFVGALCWVMNGGRFRVRHLVSVRFLLFFAIGVSAHFLFNAGPTDPQLQQSYQISEHFQLNADITLFAFQIGLLVLYGKDLINIAILWFALLFIVKKGFREILLLPDAGRSSLLWEQAVPPGVRALLLCVKGELSGAAVPFQPGKDLIIGRDPSACNLVLDSGAKGVSRVHCRLRLEDNRVMLADAGSTYGTFLANGRKLSPEKEERLTNGQGFSLAGDLYRFEIRM